MLKMFWFHYQQVNAEQCIVCSKRKNINGKLHSWSNIHILNEVFVASVMNLFDLLLNELPSRKRIYLKVE